MLYLKSLLLTIFIPGTIVLGIPYFIVTWGSAPVLRGWGAPQIAGVILAAFGAVILLHSIGLFASDGRGTLAPFDPPKRLVIKGFYRYMRNPMYGAVLMILCGEALYFESLILPVYAGVWFVFINLIVLGYEEPKLHDDFGEAYDHYCRAVHRWLPSRPYQQMSTVRG